MTLSVINKVLIAGVASLAAILVVMQDPAPAPAPAAHFEEIEVEDVPDDEDDELRELHSIRRNRRPSPGQWMEPIE